MSHVIVTTEPLKVVQILQGGLLPDPVFWPDKIATHGTSPGYQHDKWRVLLLQYDTAPGEFYDLAPDSETASVDGTALIMKRKWVPKPLGQVQGTLLARTDVAAEEARQRYLTPGVGQAMVYLQKAAEARACLADQKPKAADYPMLAAGVGIEGSTLTEVAERVAAASASWTATLARIEAARMKAKTAITAAQNNDAAVAAFSAANWGKV